MNNRIATPQEEAVYIRYMANRVKVLAHQAGPFHGTAAPMGSLTTITSTPTR